MIQMHVKIYDERTGNPAHDNRARRANRALNRVCRESMHVETPKGRRRKKAITTAEYPKYVRLVAEVAKAKHPRQVDFVPAGSR